MSDWEVLLACLPQEPAFTYDWDGLERGPLAPYFAAMKNTQQNPRWHGEGHVFTHTRMVCDALTASERFRTLPPYEQRALALAALLHDIGKPDCAIQKNGVWTSPNHAPHGARLVRSLLYRRFRLGGTEETMRFREFVCSLIRFHMIPAHLSEITKPELRVTRMAANGACIPKYSVDLLGLLAASDMRGRIPNDTSASAETVEDCLRLADRLGCRYAPRMFESEQHARARFAERPVPDPMPWGEIVVLAGLCAADRTAWAETHFSELPLLCGDAEGEARAKTLLEQKRAFTISAAYHNPQARQPIIELAESHGASVRIVYLETAWERLQKLNPPTEELLFALMPPDCYEAAAIEWHCV